MILNKCPVTYVNNIRIAGKILIALIPSGIVGSLLKAMIPIDLQKIKEIEKDKIQPKIDELERLLEIHV